MARRALCVLLFILSPAVYAASGVVVMHGKGGSPERHVSALASALRDAGFRVANLEMPWSGRRNYDVGTGAAVVEVERALAALEAQGAERLFLAGHSQGAVFALHAAGVLPVHGVVAIAPGGNVASPVFRKELGPAIAEARRLIAQGRGEETHRLADYEGSRGLYPLVARPAAWITWFEVGGAMDRERASRALPGNVPVLVVIPTRDYPAIRNGKDAILRDLPRHPATRLHEPDGDHLSAPAVAAPEAIRWMREVGAAR